MMQSGDHRRGRRRQARLAGPAGPPAERLVDGGQIRPQVCRQSLLWALPGPAESYRIRSSHTELDSPGTFYTVIGDARKGVRPSRKAGAELKGRVSTGLPPSY